MIALAAVTITALIVVGVVVIVMSRRRGDRTRFSSDVTRDDPGRPAAPGPAREPEPPAEGQ